MLKIKSHTDKKKFNYKLLLRSDVKTTRGPSASLVEFGEQQKIDLVLQ